MEARAKRRRGAAGCAAARGARAPAMEKRGGEGEAGEPRTRAQKRQRLAEEERDRDAGRAGPASDTAEAHQALRPRLWTQAAPADATVPLPGRPEASERQAPASTRQQPASPPHRPDDKDGHFQYELGESLTPRYKILAKMGEGTFGRVLECWDRQKKEYVAVKIIRNVPKYHEAALIEIDVLHALRRNDPGGTRHCVRMLETFQYRGHVCMVFERLGLSLYDFLRKNSYRPFSIDLVRDFGRQLLEAVALLHGLTLIHTDLKPENILLVSSDYDKEPEPGGKYMKRVPRSRKIRLIDFGSATYESQYHSAVVSTRHYRAPEVILGLSWSYPCDIWSVGCILIELLTGDALFQTHENLEHLAMMEAVLGPMPSSMVREADRHAQKYFRHGRDLNWPDGSSGRESERAVLKMHRLSELVSQHVPGRLGKQFTDLLMGLLKYEPNKRLSPGEALRHPFFREGMEEAAGGSMREPRARSQSGGPAGEGVACRLFPRTTSNLRGSDTRTRSASDRLCATRSASHRTSAKVGSRDRH